MRIILHSILYSEQTWPNCLPRSGLATHPAHWLVGGRQLLGDVELRKHYQLIIDLVAEFFSLINS